MREYAFVRRPDEDLAEGILARGLAEQLDLALAKEQWEMYVDALSEAGWEVIELPRIAGQRSAVFVETHAIAYARSLIMARTSANERLGERLSIAQAGALRGLTVVEISDDARLDGGDVLKYGGRVWVGLSRHTNAAGARQLAELLATYGVAVQTINCPRVGHLKKVLTALPDGTLIGYLPALADVTLDGEVVAAPEETGARVVLLGGNRLMLSASAPHTAQLLRERGFDVVTVDLSEYEKFGAGPTCLSIRVRGDC